MFALRKGAETGRRVLGWRLSSNVASTEVSGQVSKTGSKKQGISWSTSFTWFMSGVALSMGFGYYQLSHDVERCTKNVEHTLAELRRDTVESQRELRKKLAEIEG